MFENCENKSPCCDQHLLVVGLLGFGCIFLACAGDSPTLKKMHSTKAFIKHYSLLNNILRSRIRLCSYFFFRSRDLCVAADRESFSLWHLFFSFKFDQIKKEYSL